MPYFRDDVRPYEKEIPDCAVDNCRENPVDPEDPAKYNNLCIKHYNEQAKNGSLG